MAAGKDAAAAFAETLGPIEPLDGRSASTISGRSSRYRQVNLDVSVERERFPVRQIPPAESASAARHVPRRDASARRVARR